MGAPIQKCFSVLGNKLRGEIIVAIRGKPMSVTELSKRLKQERSNVSHSLALLRKCGFVNAERKGRERLYSLSNCIVSDMKVTGNIFELMEYHVKHHCYKKCLKVRK